MNKLSIPKLSLSRLSSPLRSTALSVVSLFHLAGSEAYAELAAPPGSPFAISPCGGFDGFYMGLNAGFLYETIKNAYQSGIAQNLTTTKKYGAIGGTYIGYLYEIGASRILIGLETNLLVTKTGFKVNFGPNATDIYGQANVFRKESAAITPIIGKLFNARTFLFLKAGMESIRYNFDLRYNTDATTPLLLQGSLKTVKPRIYGLVIGAGVDYLFSRQIVVGAEYNYSGLFLKYKNFVIPGTLGTESINLKRYENKVMMRLSYRFG